MGTEKRMLRSELRRRVRRGYSLPRVQQNLVAILCGTLLATTSLIAATVPQVVVGQQNTISQDVSGASVFPESTVVYLEVSQPKAVIEKLMEHPLRDDIESLSLIQRALNDDQLKYLPIVYGLIQSKTGMEWDELLKTVTQKGVYVCVDEKSKGAALLIHSGSEEKLKEAAGMLLGLIKSQATQNGGKAPYELIDYRDHKVAKFDQGLMGRIDDWLLISNNKDLAMVIADRIIDGGGTSLAGTEAFVAARSSQSEKDVWAYVDLESVRELQGNNDLFAGKTDQAGVELILGGILEALNKSSQAVIGAELTDDNISLTASMPFDSSESNKNRAFFFGPNGNALAPRRLSVSDTIADIVGYRDIAGWWNSKEELFDENVIAQLAQADSQLSTLFAGLDFGEDVLGELEPGLQIISKPQTFQDEYQPDIKIPSFALVGRLKDPALQRRLSISYKSFIGFINIQLGMEGQPQLETTSQSWEGGRREASSYLIDKDSPDGLVHYNFSPTLAFQGDYMILSSTSALADELIESAKATDSSALDEVHTGIWLQADEIGQILKINREALVVQNMIEDGNNREEAEFTIDGLLEIVELFKEAKMEFNDRDGQLQLDLNIEFKDSVVR